MGINRQARKKRKHYQQTYINTIKDKYFIYKLTKASFLNG